MDSHQEIGTQVTEGRRDDQEDLIDYMDVPSKDECPRCLRAVADVDPGVMCDSCHHWHHATCEGISPEEYSGMMSEECIDQLWHCENCGIFPNSQEGDSRPDVHDKWEHFHRSGLDVLKASRETVAAHLYKSLSQELDVWVRPTTFEILSHVNERFAKLLKDSSMRDLVKQGMFKFEEEGSFTLEKTAADASVGVTANSDLEGKPTSAAESLPSPHETAAVNRDMGERS